MAIDLKYNSRLLLFTNLLCLLTLYLAFMIVCIILNKTDRSNYYEIIKDETSEWSKGAIVDFITVPKNLSCPLGYEQESGLFYGTRGYCIVKSTGSFTIADRCRK